MSSQPKRHGGGAPFLRIAAFLAVTALAAGCAATAPSATGGPVASPGSATQPVAPPSPAGATPADSPSDITSPAPSAPEPVETHWEAAGTLHLAHVAPHLLLLGDGRAMVLGSEAGYAYGYGETVADESRFVEVWDPAHGGWRKAESLNKARGGFAAVTLPDGRVLVAGGLSPELKAYSSAYLFDPAADHWVKAGLMGTARADPAIALLADGRVLVAGGRYSSGAGDYPWAGGVEAVLAAYHEPAAGASPGATPPVDDADPGPVGHALATAEIYDPRTDTWSGTGAMRFARVGAQAVTLGDGRVLVWGARWGDDRIDGVASSGEIYDPATGRFRLVPALPDLGEKAILRLGVPAQEGTPGVVSYDGAGLVGLSDGDALLVDTETEWGDLLVTRTMRYDASRDAWERVGGLFATTDWWDETDSGKDWGTRHPDGVVVPLPDGRVLFAGGTRKRAAELLDPDTETWSALPKMPAARSGGTGLVLDDGSVLVVGSGGYTDAFRLVLGS